ncbi:hypothetical protein E2C01_013898 [Portunus trituberculatus]|uniref:Uncharacterized protein n=1 Tax=Portunus trituberculatus TaxID=210409 RepID=A0A5B7DI94_PORTR|nr:hypothetical protein [Portunus trituberculatus]
MGGPKWTNGCGRDERGRVGQMQVSVLVVVMVVVALSLLSQVKMPFPSQEHAFSTARRDATPGYT